MKARLIELLSSPSGKAVRDALGLNGEDVFTEVFHLKLRQASERQSTCDIKAVIAKVAEDATLSGQAVEVDFQCLGVQALGYAHDGQQAEFDGMEAHLYIDTGDRFRILCQDFVVTNVRAYNLADEPR